jgi:hypothetical protein
MFLSLVLSSTAPKRSKLKAWVPLHLNEADFVKKALGYAGFKNNLMARTTLKKLTTTQAIIDGIIASKESQVQDMLILAVDLDDLIEDFVDLLNDNNPTDLANPTTLFTVNQFKQGGECKEFFEQLYISIQIDHSTQTITDTFWQNTHYLTAWRTTLDLNETGGYILVRMSVNCSTTTTLYRLLNKLGGKEVSTGVDIRFGYLPKQGNIELEFMNFIGVCTDSNEYSRRLKSYCTQKDNEKVQTQVKTASNSEERDEARTQKLRSML